MSHPGDRRQKLGATFVRLRDVNFLQTEYGNRGRKIFAESDAAARKNLELRQRVLLPSMMLSLDQFNPALHGPGARRWTQLYKPR